MKSCKYRNCENQVVEEHKIYCCRRCKSSEAVYRIRDNKPKGKIGRPKQVYKRITQLTEEDKRILELVMRKVD